MRTKTEKITSFSPAWINDVNFSTNPGYLMFKNGRVNELGKIKKRKGWQTIIRHTQPATPPGQEGNLPLVYNRPVAGSNNCARTNVIDCKTKKTATGEIQKYIIKHSRRNGENVLEKIVLDSNNNPVGSAVTIGTAAQFKNYGPVKFIKTNDQVYIINTFNNLSSGKKQGYIWKYGYGDNIKTMDTDRIHNISNANSVYGNYELIDVPINNGNPILPGSYFYVIIPVYNTGSEGRYNYIAGGEGAWSGHDAEVIYVNIPNLNVPRKAVILKVKSIYDPYITHYKIYRSKHDKSFVDGIYFLFQIEKPVNKSNKDEYNKLINPAAQIVFVSPAVGYVGISDRSGKDTDLGSLISSVPFLNSNRINWRETVGNNPPITVYDNALNLPVNCGNYIDNRLILGYGNRIYFSLIDKLDSLDGTLTLIMPLAHETENPATAIETAGLWVFVFCKSCIYKLMPTSSSAAPYQLSLISNSYGTDNLQSIISMDNIIYFMFKNKLFAMNNFGQIKPIGGAIESIFLTAIEDIYFYKNDKEGFIKICFRTADGEREVDYWPAKNMFVDVSGYRDIANPTGERVGAKGVVELLSKNERLKLMAYTYNTELGEEWGVTFDGDIVKRSADFEDVSIVSAIVSWQDYQFLGNVPTIKNQYNVNLEFIKSFTYSERVYFPSAVFSGTGDIWVSYAIDDSDIYSKEKLITLTKDAVETILDTQGFTCKIKVRHDSNAEIDLDYFGVKVFSEGKVDFMNNVDNGE